MRLTRGEPSPKRPLDGWAPRAKTSTPAKPAKPLQSGGWRKGCGAAAAARLIGPPPTWRRSSSAAKSQSTGFARPTEPVGVIGGSAKVVRWDRTKAGEWTIEKSVICCRFFASIHDVERLIMKDRLMAAV